jgi:hypothetical protein
VSATAIETGTSRASPAAAPRRFGRGRAGLIALFVLDVVLSVAWVVHATGPASELEAWYQAGFPSNLVVLTNHTDAPMRDLEVVLDGRFLLKIRALMPGPTGFQIDREFRDARRRRPDAGYKPQSARVTVGDDVYELLVVDRDAPKP